MFEDLIKNIEVAIKDIEQLKKEAEDLEKGKKDGVKNNGIQPMTRLRGSIEDAKKEKEDPDTTKILDKFDDIIERAFKNV